MYSENAPKVIYLQLGNITLKELHFYFEENWNSIIAHLDKTSLIIAQKDQIKVIE
jgi:predicted nuclease of predicted toxin-antitoxin system